MVPITTDMDRVNKRKPAAVIPACRESFFCKFSLALIFIVILNAVMLGGAAMASAASRFAVANGNWNATSTWSATSGGAPGASVPVAGDDVFIAEGTVARTVTIPSGYSAACASVTMGNVAANRAGILNFTDSTSSLSVSGNVTMNRPSGGSTTTIGLGAGSMTVSGNLELTRHVTSSPAINRVNRITISTGTLTVGGNLIFGAEAAAQSQIVFSGAGTMNLAGAFTLQNNLGTLTPSTGTVNFNGTASQTIPIGVSAVRYNNLTINNTSVSGATISAAITGTLVTGNLSVQTGTFQNGGFAVTLASTKNFAVSSGATFKLSGTSSMVTVSGGGTKTFNSSSTVNYAGTTQTVSADTYGNLTIGSGTKTFTSPVTAAGTLALDSSAVASLASGGSYTANALTIGGVLQAAGSWGNTGSGAANIDPVHFAGTGVLNVSTGAANAAHSTISPATASITANGTSTQVITVQARDANNNNLTIGGSTVVISMSSGTGTVGSTTDNGNGTYTATVTSPTATGSGTFVATLGGVSVGTAVGASSSTVTYIATGTWLGATSIDWNTASNWWGGVPTSSTDVVIPSTAPNQPVIGASGGLSRNITIDTGASLTISGSYNLSVSGDWTNNGTFTPGTGTVVFNGGSAQTISGSSTTTFNDLTINNTSGITARSDITVNGVLNLQSANPSATAGSLNMWDGAAMKTLTMGGFATTIGAGDVTGIVKRTSFVAAVPYTFGNQYTTVTFENIGTLPTELSVKITLSAPGWKTEAIRRTYAIIQNGAVNSFATVNIHYLDSELQLNTENKLVFWRSSFPFATATELGRANYNTTNNWVGTPRIPVHLLPTSFGQAEATLGDSLLPTVTWNGSSSTDWFTPANWTPNGLPSDLSDVVIPDAATTPNDPTLPIGDTGVGRLSIESGGILNSADSSTLTISGGSGAWINIGGTFNPSTGTVIFTNAAATIAGTTDFYNVTIDPGAGLQMQDDSTMRIGGTMTNNGVWDSTTETHTTVEYNGGVQTVIIPNGPLPGYHNLILSGSGNKTMASTTTIHDTLEINDTARFNLTYASGSSSTVGALMFDGVLQAAGSWGSTSSAATHKDDTHFQGTGMLNVSTGSADHITITSSTANLSSGSARDITAEIRDANENVVTSDNSTVVSFAQTSGAGSVSGTGSATASSGIATKTVTGVTVGSVTLTASATGLTSGTTTFTVTVGAADAAQSTLTPASASITANGTSTQVLTVTAKDANGNTLSTGGATVTITRSSGSGTIGSVTDNGNGTYTATVTSPTSTGSGVFVATVGGQPVRSGTGSQTQVTVTYVAIALKSVVDENGGNLEPGDTLLYTIVMQNQSGFNVSGIEFTDSLPNNTTYIAASASAPAGSTIVSETPVLRITGINVPAHGQVTITFRVSVNNPLPAGVTQISNQGTVFYDSNGDGINDTTQQTDGDTTQPGEQPTAIAGPAVADVTTDVTAPVSANAGSTVNVSISFTNNGPSTAVGVTYTATLPAVLSGVICTGAICNYNSGTGVVSITGLPGTLTNGQTENITLSFTAPASGTVSVTATIGTSTDQGSNVAPDTASGSTAVNSPNFYTPVAIPTLTEWGFIIFMTLAALGSVWHLRKKRES